LQILFFRVLPYSRPGDALSYPAEVRYGLQVVIYLERLKRALSTERGVHLTFSSGNTEETVELSPEAADQVRQALQVVTSKAAGEDQLTLTVLGHQVVRRPDAYGLLLRTQEFGDVVFSLPQAILRRLITDLTQLVSSPPALRTFGSGEATGHARGKIGARHP
jgi:hypothetical protein